MFLIGARGARCLPRPLLASVPRSSRGWRCLSSQRSVGNHGSAQTTFFDPSYPSLVPVSTSKKDHTRMMRQWRQNTEREEAARSQARSQLAAILLGTCVAGAAISIGQVLAEEQRDHAVKDVKKNDGTEGKEEDSLSDTTEEPLPPAGHVIDGLPEFSLDELSNHKTSKDRIWVAYQYGVYDITDFVIQHPGGSKIMLAAGDSIDPYWALYRVHSRGDVLRMLESYRIGNIDAKGREIIDERKVLMNQKGEGVYANEPPRSPLLTINSRQPFNAEPPLHLVSELYLTPTPIFFVRNHLPVPLINEDDYVLTVSVEGGASKQFTLEDLKTRFPQYELTATMQCAGNRRKEMAECKEVKGLSWGGAAISNAVWKGPRLRDVLEAVGVNESSFKWLNVNHIQFEGLDKDMTTNYGASIPVHKAISVHGDCILAHTMNGDPLPIDHGFPVRAVVPGTVGARNVKWLGKIVASHEESRSHWQRKDYKVFSPSTTWETADWDRIPAIQELPVQSAICDPVNNAVLDIQAEELNLKGYAFSGGGRSIIRVDVSLDGGNEWLPADLMEGSDQEPQRAYAWTLWELSVPITEEMRGKEYSIVVRAVDSSQNSQPEICKSCWNMRGLLCNSWHNIHVKIQ